MNSLLTTLTSARAATELPRRLPSTATPFATVALRAADIAVLLIAGCVAVMVAVQPRALAIQSDYGYHLLVAALFLPFVMDKAGSYAADRLHRVGDLCSSAAFGCAILFGALLAIDLSLDGLDRQLGIWFAAWGLCSVCGMVAVRAALAIVVPRLLAGGRLRETIAIVGTNADSLRLAGQLGRDPSQPFDVLGVFSAGSAITDARFAGSLADLIKLGQARRIDKVIIAAPTSCQPEVHRVIHVLKSLAVDVLLAPHGAGGQPLVRAVERVGELAVIRIATPRSADASAPTAQAA